MIHQYKNNGYNIVLDVNSGSVHVVDDCVYEIVPVLEPILKAGLSGETAIEAACMACEKLPYSSNEIREVLGRHAKSDLKKGTPLQWELID